MKKFVLWISRLRRVSLWLIFGFGILSLGFILLGCGAVTHYLDSIDVTPPTAEVLIGGTKQFTAAGRDENGNIIAFKPTWSVTPEIGTITSLGLFTATSTGDGKVYARGDGVSDYATVTVIEGSLESIEISPETWSMSTWTTKELTAIGYNSEGGKVPIDPTWNLSGVTGTFNPLTGETTVFTANTGGLGTIQATYLSKTGTATFDASTQTVNITVNADAYVSSTEGDTNFGSNTPLKCGIDDSSGSKYLSYLDFDLSSIPSTVTIVSGIFKIYVEERSPSDQSISIRLKEVSSTWDASTITYNSQPTSGEVMTNQTIDNEGSKDIDITSTVQNWISGTTTNDGFLMEPSTSNLRYFKFSAKESAYTDRRPKISVTY